MPSTQVKITHEQASLTPEDLIILKRIKTKKLFFISSTYIAFVGILPLALAYGWGKSARFSEKIQQAYWLVAPMGALFYFIVLSVYFFRNYKRSVQPFQLDIRNGIKTLIYSPPDTYKTPFFEEYFIRTELNRKKYIKISKEMYDSIRENSLLCICIAPCSQFVFHFTLDGKSVHFSEKNESEA